jgi:phosphatidate cytidylyltransferase
MTAREQTILLFGGITAVLVLASAVGFVLARRMGADNPMIENLNQRIKAWWVMVALVGLTFVLGKTAIIVLYALVSFFALREFMTLLPTRRADHSALAALFFVVLPLQYWLVHQDRYGIYSIFIPVYAFLFLPITAVLRGDTAGFMRRVAEVQWAAMVCVYCVSYVPALLYLQIPGYEGRNLLLIAFLVLVVQSSDVLQYVWGKLFGRRKIAALISPSKTIEGLVGGVVSATLLGAALFWITPFTPFEAMAMAFVVALMGFFGGLVMSAIKRDLGIKDWGRMIEGHGGMLDRFDSVIFAAPIFFHLTRFWWSVR